MNNTTKYIDFEEGNLSPQEETMFFEQLAQNDAFRAEYKGFKTIANSSKTLANTHKPSAELTAGLFATLGIEPEVIPANIHSPIPAKAKVAKVGNISRKSQIITGVLSATTAFIIAFLLLKFGNINNETFLENNPVLDNTAIIADSYSDSNGNNIKNTNATNGNAIYADMPIDTPIDTVIRYVYIQQKVAEKAEKKAEEKMPNDFRDIAQSSISPIESENIYASTSINTNDNHNNNFGSAVLPEGVIVEPLYNRPFFNPDIDIELRGFNYANLQKVDIYPANYNMLNNLGLSLYKRFGEKFSLGAEVRQETFYCEYSGLEDGNLEYIYKQQPNFTTFTANLRYNVFLDPDWSVFAQLGLGGNQAGFVARPALGVELFNNMGLSFILGVDNSIFAYPYQNNWFGTSKIGLNYGIRYHL